jgi:hypothetical protein
MFLMPKYAGAIDCLDHSVAFLLLASLNVPNVAEAVWHRSPSVDLIACDSSSVVYEGCSC